MTSHRELKPAAEGQSVNGGHHRDANRLDHLLYRFLRGFFDRTIELVDIRARAEEIAR
jgi:hypothetical protein